MLVQPGVTGRAIRFGFLPLLPRHHAMRARARIGIGADPHGIDRAENAAAVGLAAADDVAPPAAALEDFHWITPASGQLILITKSTIMRGRSGTWSKIAFSHGPMKVASGASSCQC
jgi:hypothetical protein